MFRLKRHFSILLCLLFALGTTLAFVQESEAKRVYVKGYYRKDGTYVRGHYRTAPDGNPYNNYSTPGNYNPNTGKVTGGNLDTYLKNYNKKGWTFPSQRKYASPSASEILGETSVAPSSKKPFTSVRKSSMPQNMSQILAEVRALRQEIANLQREVDQLRNKPAQTPVASKISSPSTKGEIAVRIKKGLGDIYYGDWIYLTNGQIWECRSISGVVESSIATIYKFSHSYKLLTQGSNRPISVERIK